MACTHKISVKIVMIVVGSLWVVTKDLNRWLKNISVGDAVGGWLASAIIGTNATLRKLLFESVN